MQEETHAVRIFLVVDAGDMVSSLRKLIEKAGYRVDPDDGVEELLRCLDNPETPVIRLDKDTGDGTDGLDLAGLTGSYSPPASCVIITSKELRALVKSMRKSRLHADRRPNSRRTLDEMEKDHIVAVLEENGWQYKNAAKLLGIDRSTLYRKMKKYSIGKDR